MGNASSTFYHGTNAVDAADILRNGFAPGLWLADNFELAKWYAENKNTKEEDSKDTTPIVLKVELPPEYANLLIEDELEVRGGWYLEYELNKTIPPKFISITQA